MTPDGNWQNLFLVTINGDMNELGDRTFGLWQLPDDPLLHLAVSDPNGDNGVKRVDEFSCNDGEWATYSVEVSQVSGAPSTLQYTTKINGNDLHTSTYAASVAPKNSDLQVFVANNDPHHNPATGYSVKNFFYQTFEEVPPCALENEPAFILSAKTASSNTANTDGRVRFQ